MMKFGKKTSKDSSSIEKKKQSEQPPQTTAAAFDLMSSTAASQCVVMGVKVSTVSKPSYLSNQYPVNSLATLNRMYRIDGINGTNQQLLQSPPKKKKDDDDDDRS